MDQVITWVIKNFTWMSWSIGLVVQSFIAYHIFALTKRLSNKARLEHIYSIKQQTDEHLQRIHLKKLNSGVYLVNIDRYFKDYPSNEEKRFAGYTHIRAEIKGTRFDGIEFFEGPPVYVYRNKDGKLSLKGTPKEKVLKAFPVGLVPYEWIEHIDIRGDEYAFVPLFFCRFKAKTNFKFWKQLRFFKYPYKRISYYQESEVFNEGNDPFEMKYMPIMEKVFS